MKEKIVIDIVVPPYSGHLNPILELIKPFINDNKYDICIYTTSKKREFLEKLGLKCNIILKDKPNILENIANTSKKTNVFLSYNQFKENIKLVPEVMEELKRGFTERNPDVIIADFITIPVGIIADEMGIPWISSMPTPFIIESRTTTPSYMGGWYPKENIFYKVRDCLGRNVIKLFKLGVILFANKTVKGLNYTLYNEKGYERAYSKHSILALGMKEIEFRDDFPEHLKWTGACISEFSNDINSFVSELKYEKKILVTIGTHLLWGKNELVEMVKKISEKFPEICFIISLGDINSKDEKVEKIKENIYLYKYIDYGEILPTVDYVIHHGGAGIFYSCIKYKKPAIIIPHDYDQFDFAVRGEIAKVGIRANSKKINTIIESINKVLNKKDWTELEKLSEKMKEYNPNEILKNEINRLLNKK